MAGTLLVDTDILVDFLRGHEKAVKYVKGHAQDIVLSAIAVAELYAGVRGKDEEKQLDKFVSVFPVLPVTLEVARAGGLVRRQYQASHGVGLADALVFATAAVNGAELKTLNTKHYPMIKRLKAPYVKS